jgi:hypothetical protein
MLDEGFVNEEEFEREIMMWALDVSWHGHMNWIVGMI